MTYKGKLVGQGGPDIFADDKLVVELKAVESITEIFKLQAKTYLCRKNLHLAIVINFNVAYPKDGITLVVKTR